jgi:hypothetical protein
VANWKSEMMLTPNAAPGQNGDLLPGIAGRLYLFGPKLDFPFACDGAVTVDLYDDTAPPGPNGQPPVIERWHFDSLPLKRLLVKDFVGWGYTLFLPLEHYRPEGVQGHLRVTFEPAHGGPLYTQNAPVVFHQQTDSGPVVTTQTRQVVPGSPVVQPPPGGAVSPAAALPQTQRGAVPAGMPVQAAYQAPSNRVSPVGMPGPAIPPAPQYGVVPAGAVAPVPAAVPAGPQAVQPPQQGWVAPAGMSGPAAVPAPQYGVAPAGASVPVTAAAPVGPQAVQPQQGRVTVTTLP